MPKSRAVSKLETNVPDSDAGRYTPTNFQTVCKINVDPDGIPLNIPPEMMKTVITQVLIEMRDPQYRSFEQSQDKIAIAAERKIKQLRSLGEDTLRGMTDDTMAQIVVMSMVPSGTRPLEMLVNNDRKSEPADTEVPDPDVITAAEIAHCLDKDEQITKFKKAIESFVIPPPLEGRFSKAIEQLGMGGSGVVYRCFDHESCEQVAIKVMALKEQQKLELLYEELRIMRTLHHEHIINYMQSFVRQRSKGGESLFVVMEFLDGNALYLLLCNSNKYYLAEPEIAYVSQCTLSALDFLHSKAMIHRDIKSDNILVGKDGRCKLTDFGFCTRLERDSLRKTQIGTPCWMAPEMLHKRGYDHRIDTWSYGITLIECIDLDPPFIMLPALEAMACISQLNALPPSKNFRNVSEDLQMFIEEHLELNRMRRKSCGELLKHRFIETACSKERFASVVSANSKP